MALNTIRDQMYIVFWLIHIVFPYVVQGTVTGTIKIGSDDSFSTLYGCVEYKVNFKK